MEIILPEPAMANAFWNCGFPLIAQSSAEESHFHNINNGTTKSGHLKERALSQRKQRQLECED